MHSLDKLKQIKPTITLKNKTNIPQTLYLNNDSIQIMPYSLADIQTSMLIQFPDSIIFSLEISDQEKIDCGLLTINTPVETPSPVAIIPVSAASLPVSAPQINPVEPVTNNPVVKEGK
jgi:hypothetical protein